MVTPEGEITVKEFPSTGALSQLQAEVGGYVEGISGAQGIEGYANEEGLIIGLPYNEIAAAVVGHPIVGTVVLFGGVDSDGEMTSITTAQEEFVRSLL